MAKVVDLGLYDKETGEVVEAQVKAIVPYGKRTVSMMYGAGWMAIPSAGCAKLVDAKLSHTAMRVLFFMLGRVEPGNHIRLRQIDIARRMRMSASQVCRALKELREVGAILQRDPFFRLHPDFGWRGDPTGHVAKRTDGTLVFIDEAEA